MVAETLSKIRKLRKQTSGYFLTDKEIAKVKNEGRP